MAAKTTTTTRHDVCRADGCTRPRHVYKSGRVDRSLCTEHGAMWKDGFRLTQRAREALALKASGAAAATKAPKPTTRKATVKGHLKGTTIKDGVVIESPKPTPRKPARVPAQMPALIVPTVEAR